MGSETFTFLLVHALESLTADDASHNPYKALPGCAVQLYYTFPSSEGDFVILDEDIMNHGAHFTFPAGTFGIDVQTVGVIDVGKARCKSLLA